MKMRALLLAGLSGAGKSSIADLLSESGDFMLARSATTRERRGDGRGEEYIYLSRDEFLRLAESGEFLEYTDFSENLYGTPISELQRIFAAGKIPILVLDINGIKSIRKRAEVDTLSVYIHADIEELDRRLEYREKNSKTPPEQTEKRKQKNRDDAREFSKNRDLFDLVIENKTGKIKDTAEKIRRAFFEAQGVGQN